MPHPAIATVADIARVYGAERPDSVALIAGERTVTFADLDARSSQVAQALRAAGVGFGDRVAFIEKNGIEFFEIACGVSKLGAVVVPVNWRLATPEIHHIIDDAGARVVIVGSEFHERVAGLGDVRVVTIADYDDWVAGHPAEDPRVPTGPDDIAFLMYTSGTTGSPKGVMLTNDNYFCKATGIADKWRFDVDSVSLAVMPLFHMAGSGWALVGLCEGARTVVLRDVDPPAILDAVARHRITNMLLVPVVIQRLLDTPGVEATDFSALRAIVYGASPITDDVLSRALARFDCDLLQVYGMTETTGSITQLERHDPELLRSCGRPFGWVEVRVVDDAGRDVPAGTVGELWTRSRQNMRGYWNNPEATAATLTDDGWLKTGDAGYLDGEGNVFLHDRVKDMIVSGGENVYPVEVENVLMTHPDVADVAVIGVPDPTWGEAVKAIVVPTAGASPAAADLIAFARDRLAGYKLPKSVSFTDTLPRTPSGKVLKRSLREPYWAGAGRRIG
ncbi:MAG TPA: long-chain-fatty-acid--CoA ligase [Mycobacterium sp.]|nr:long-chain-fatty-acid--CoA ligase [Mycobacterium sp.]